MIEKVEGIVVKETPYGDTSKIINVFTKEHGIIGIMAKGAKSMKSKLRSSTTKFSYGYFHVYYKEDKLSNLIAVDIIDDFKSIKKDILLLGYLNYLTELVTQTVKQSSESFVYDLFILGILKINNGFDPKIITNIIEIKLLPLLGVSLNLDGCAKCGNTHDILTIDPDVGGYVCKNCYTDERIVDIKTIKMLRMYYYVDLKSISKLSISSTVSNNIDYFLDKYYERYTGLYLQSKKFLKNIKNY